MHSCSALQKSSIPVYLELPLDWGLVTEPWCCVFSALSLAQVPVSATNADILTRKMSVSALIKASRSWDFSWKPVLQCAELRGSRQSPDCVTNVTTRSFSESILWVLIRNPVLIRRVRTWWHLEGRWHITKVGEHPGQILFSDVLDTTNVIMAWKNVTRIRWRVSLCQLFWPCP